ncbi:hypothetical protein PMI01_01302, partial [Caulobacter sp. AP07]
MVSRRVCARLAACVAALCGASVVFLQPALAQETSPPVAEAPPVKASVTKTTDEATQAAETQAAETQAAETQATGAKIAPPVANLAPEPDPTDGVGHPAELRPPVYSATDANGVNLITGSYSQGELINSIGGRGGRGLEASNSYFSGTGRGSMNSYFQLSDDSRFVYTNLVLQGESMTFRGNPTSGCCVHVGDSVGSWSYPGSVITYTAPDGRVATFENRTWSSNNPTPIGLITSLKYPTGEVLTFTRDGSQNTKIESSLGYALVGPGGGAFSALSPVAANLRNGGCDTTQCSGPTYANEMDRGRTLTASGSAPIGGPFTLTFRNATGDKPRTYSLNITTDDQVERVTSFTDGVSTWTYSYVYVVDTWSSVGTQYLPTDGILTTTATGPQNYKRVVKSRTGNGHVLSDTDSEGHTTTYQYVGDEQGLLGKGKLVQVTMPEGNRTYFKMDGYRNVTAMWRIPKGAEAGVVDPDLKSIPGATVVRAGYSCRPTPAGGQNCTSPDWMRDARGNQTDYAYDADTGELLSATQPAGPNGVRPQVRYAYGAFTARYLKNGVMTAASPVRRLVRSSTCAIGAAPACLGTADETVTEYGYEDSNAPNNVRLTSVTTRAGDNSLSATTTYAYNDRGDVISVDGPLPGSNDLVQAYYDASRWQVGEVGVDPDGTGYLRHRARKSVYRADGQVSASYVGVVADRSEATFNDSFQVLSSSTIGYDGQARAVLQTAYGTGGQAVAQSQTAFDDLGRPICSTVRMNPAYFGEPPASACNPGPPGGDNPDRITFTTYDRDGRPLTVTSGYKSGAPRVEKTITYTDNGLEATVADGKP